MNHMLGQDVAQATSPSSSLHIIFGSRYLVIHRVEAIGFLRPSTYQLNPYQCPETFPVTRAFQYLPDLEVPSVPKSWDQKSSGIQA